ncbi:hypothetical protein L6164_016098 [Bauhinia variegata]|uniref:Uncharacterized protein n=1 Tax=Bauhinia variegata TaxID=167791 RepID=A0ACB9NPY0_BAUVA|nr:hypothetical protein L6164_016098 [Bauhinia variegata]
MAVGATLTQSDLLFLDLLSELSFKIRRIMDQFNNDDLDYVVADYYDFPEFEDGGDLYEDNGPQGKYGSDYVDSDFEDDFEMTKSKNDTSAMEARAGKDIQGIPWERLNYGRDKYRQTRLKQYKNYENLSLSREELEKECLEVEKGKNFYDFHFNTRLVKSTIVHFQASYLSLYISF